MSAFGPLDPKDRLLRVLRRQPVDRPPAICAGGSMTAAVLEAVGADAPLPAAHTDPVLMAELCARIQQRTGFENLGTPLCATIEAEALGSLVNLGTLSCEPTLVSEAFPDITSARLASTEAWWENGRIPVFLEATRLLARDYPALPVLANLIGPTSTAAAVVQPMAFMKGLRKERDSAHRLIATVTRFLCGLADRLIERGADAIVIHDDTATPDLLGPALFRDFTIGYLTILIEHIHARGTPVILHLCGNLEVFLPMLANLDADALSVGAATRIRAVRLAIPGLPVMGNVGTLKMHQGHPDDIVAHAQRLLAEGVDILAPACGLSTRTPLANIQALVSAATTKRPEDMEFPARVSAIPP